MKISVSTICGLSPEYISSKIKVDAFEVVRLNNNVPLDKICSAQSIFYQLFDSPIFESTKSIDKALDVLDWCKNIPNIVFGNPKLRNINSNKEKQNAISFFTEYTKRYNNIISIEPLNTRYGTNFADSYLNTVKFVNSLNNPRVKINLDLGSCAMTADRWFMYGYGFDLINHIHISGKQLTPIKDTDMNYYKDAIKRLINLGYNKYISLESLNFDSDINKFIELITPYKN